MKRGKRITNIGRQKGIKLIENNNVLIYIFDDVMKQVNFLV